MNAQATTPATPRQRYALYCITKQDYRNVDITYDEASKMIQELGDPNYQKKSKIKSYESEKKDILKYLKDNHKEILDFFYKQMGYKSLIVDDLDPERNPKYVFYGFGCGFAWVKGDKRNPHFKRVVLGDKDKRESALYDSIEEFKGWFIKKVDSKLKNEMLKNGSPIQAVLYQDMNINEYILQTAVEYIRDKYDIKNIWVESRLD